MTAPRRIQLRRTAGFRLREVSPNAVVVARPSKWGNPYRAGLGLTGPTAGDAVARYRTWLERTYPGQTVAAMARTELRGRDLACWCTPSEPCHADVLLEIANRGGAA